jgi:hypothetical protein
LAGYFREYPSRSFFLRWPKPPRFQQTVRSCPAVFSPWRKWSHGCYKPT